MTDLRQQQPEADPTFRDLAILGLQFLVRLVDVGRIDVPGLLVALNLLPNVLELQLEHAWWNRKVVVF